MILHTRMPALISSKCGNIFLSCSCKMVIITFPDFFHFPWPLSNSLTFPCFPGEWSPCAEAKFKVLLPRSFVPRLTEYICQVSSTSAKRSRSLRVLKTLTLHGQTDRWTFDQFYTSSWERWLTRGQSNLTKSASRGAHSPIRGHPRGSKVVPLNSWGRVSY